MRRDYGKCYRSCRELITEVVKCFLIVLGLSLFFYRSIWAAIPLSAVGILCWKADSGRKAGNDRDRLLLQFRDMIRSVASSMTAGYSVENAFLQSYEDMCMMHGRGAMICQELGLIRRGLVMNLTLEELLYDFGQRSRTEQIQEFASVFLIARRNGGSMTEVIRSFAEGIYRQAATREEIMTQTAGRRMEQRIMNIMPFAILIYVDVSSKGYFDMLYHNFSGIAVMTVCLLIYLAACFLSEKILRKAVSV